MKKLALIIVIIIAVFTVYRVQYSSNLKPLNPNDQANVVVAVEQGMSLKQIADLLEEKKVIRSAGAFVKFARNIGADKAIQAATYTLKPSQSVEQILQVMQSGDAENSVLTIPEGYTVKDIDALLAERGLIEAGDFLECARSCSFDGYDFLPSAGDLAERAGRVEGYLFPDTYFVTAGTFTSEELMHRMLDTFRQRVIDDYGTDIANDDHSLHEVVTMASLVEEETRTDDERPVVAGILWKRLDEGMRLDVDAAVRYFLDKPSSAITRSDLETDSPYNLRKVRGLPPGPITNAGLKSIVAALRPKASPYYYYLHGSDGQIRYAATNDEHNQNKAQYLR